MIKQIINNEKELIDLIKRELEDHNLSNNQHGNNSEEELRTAVNNFIETESPIEYPVFMFAEFRYLYQGLDISLYYSSCQMNKKQMKELIKQM